MTQLYSLPVLLCLQCADNIGSIIQNYWGLNLAIFGQMPEFCPFTIF